MSIEAKCTFQLMNSGTRKRESKKKKKYVQKSRSQFRRWNRRESTLRKLQHIAFFDLYELLINELRDASAYRETCVLSATARKSLRSKRTAKQQIISNFGKIWARQKFGVCRSVIRTVKVSNRHHVDMRLLCHYVSLRCCNWHRPQFVLFAILTAIQCESGQLRIAQKKTRDRGRRKEKRSRRRTDSIRKKVSICKLYNDALHFTSPRLRNFPIMAICDCKISGQCISIRQDIITEMNMFCLRLFVHTLHFRFIPVVHKNVSTALLVSFQ